jgi:polyphosphate kinase
MPVMIDQLQEMPVLDDDMVYLAICLRFTDKKKRPIHALIKIPSKALPRFIILPEQEDKKFIIFLDDIIRYGLFNIFYMFNPKEIAAYTIKVTRDAELDITDDISESYINNVVRGLQKRKEGDPVRFIYDENMPAPLLKMLMKKMNLKNDDTIIPGERYHNFKDLLDLPSFGMSELSVNKLKPLQHPSIQPGKSIIQSIFKNDILLYFPYHSFNYFIDLLREASIDPKVKSIKITLYRLANHSNVISALINAARNGKHVTALLELQARFDEEANIKYGSTLRDEGVKVLYGVPGLKVHAKLCVIERIEGRTTTNVACIGTGNFNESTAKVYIDAMILTSDRKITNDVVKIFDFFNRTYQREQFYHLMVSPFNSRQKITRLITNEITNAKKGMPAYIYLKLNNLVDDEIIKLLYKASNAGVKIRLNVRGMFSLKPDNHSEITAIGIVDSYLEHSRFMIFCNAGEEKYFMSSADFMTRNLDRRIEIICPVYNKLLQEQIRLIFDASWSENLKARILDDKLSNNFKTRQKSTQPFRSQTELYKLLDQFHKKGMANENLKSNKN